MTRVTLPCPTNCKLRLLVYRFSLINVRLDSVHEKSRESRGVAGHGHDGFVVYCLIFMIPKLCGKRHSAFLYDAQVSSDEILLY